MNYLMSVVTTVGTVANSVSPIYFESDSLIIEPLGGRAIGWCIILYLINPELGKSAFGHGVSAMLGCYAVIGIFGSAIALRIALNYLGLIPGTITITNENAIANVNPVN